MQIPLCHSVALSSVHVRLRLVPDDFAVAITAHALTVGQTGARHSLKSHVVRPQ